MCDSLDRILNRMSKVVHWIDAPGITGSVVSHMSNTVDDRVTHVHIRGCHVDLGTENFLSILVFAVFHFFKKLKVFFDAAVTVWAFFAWLCKSTTVFADLIGSQIADISFALLDELDSSFIHLRKIIRRKEKSVFPVSTEPFDVRFDGLYKFALFFGRVGIIETHVEFAVVFLCKSIV